MVLIKPQDRCERGVRFGEACKLCWSKLHQRTLDVLDFFHQQKKKEVVCTCPGFCMLHTKFKEVSNAK